MFQAVFYRDGTGKTLYRKKCIKIERMLHIAMYPLRERFTMKTTGE